MLWQDAGVDARRLPGIGDVAVEITMTVGDAELGAKGEHHAHVEHNAG
jgi:hypothetical protein